MPPGDHAVRSDEEGLGDAEHAERDGRATVRVQDRRPGVPHPLGVRACRLGAVLVDDAIQGDKIANEVYRFTGEILGKALANFIMFSSPEAIILFGGLCKAGELIYNPTQKHMEDNILPIFKNKVKLIFSELKESDAAILGASALVWESKKS